MRFIHSSNNLTHFPTFLTLLPALHHFVAVAAHFLCLHCRWKLAKESFSYFWYIKIAVLDNFPFILCLAGTYKKLYYLFFVSLSLVSSLESFLRHSIKEHHLVIITRKIIVKFCEVLSNIGNIQTKNEFHYEN